MFCQPGRGGSISSTQENASARILLDGRTDADQVAVAEGLVDPRDPRPDLEFPRGRRGETRALARVGPVPLVRGYLLKRVGSIVQQVFVPRRYPRLDLGDLFADGDHRVAEAVQLLLRFALG